MCVPQYLVWVVGVALEPGPRRWLLAITVVLLATVLQNANHTLMCAHVGHLPFADCSLLQSAAWLLSLHGVCLGIQSGE